MELYGAWRLFVIDGLPSFDYCNFPEYPISRSREGGSRKAVGWAPRRQYGRALQSVADWKACFYVAFGPPECIRLSACHCVPCMPSLQISNSQISNLQSPFFSVFKIQFRMWGFVVISWACTIVTTCFSADRAERCYSSGAPSSSPLPLGSDPEVFH